MRAKLKKEKEEVCLNVSYNPATHNFLHQARGQGEERGENFRLPKALVLTHAIAARGRGKAQGMLRFYAVVTHMLK